MRHGKTLIFGCFCKVTMLLENACGLNNCLLMWHVTLNFIILYFHKILRQFVSGVDQCENSARTLKFSYRHSGLEKWVQFVS